MVTEPRPSDRAIKPVDTTAHSQDDLQRSEGLGEGQRSRGRRGVQVLVHQLCRVTNEGPWVEAAGSWAGLAAHVGYLACDSKFGTRLFGGVWVCGLRVCRLSLSHSLTSQSQLTRVTVSRPALFSTTVGLRVNMKRRRAGPGRPTVCGATAPAAGRPARKSLRHRHRAAHSVPHSTADC